MNHGKVTPTIAAGLKTLRKRIDASKIPSSKLDETLNIATWNIREFGRRKRSDAAIHYIAEIIGQFDVVSIVELRENLDDLHRVLAILGTYWDVVYSDAVLDPGGNRERIGFVFDRRAATFNGLAAEASAPRTKKGTEYLSDDSFWRAPYMASFRAGSFDFVLLAVHVRWSDEDDRQRELGLLANWVAAKSKEEFVEDKDLLVLGDFNVPSRESPLFKTLLARGLQIPRALAKDEFGSNLARDKRYDQILHLPVFSESFTNAGGVLDYYVGDHRPLFPADEFPDLDKDAFTYQLSDHLPLWLQINTDLEGVMLNQIIQDDRRK